MSAEVAKQPLERGRWRRSEPMKEMKELESVFRKLARPVDVGSMVGPQEPARRAQRLL